MEKSTRPTLLRLILPVFINIESYSRSISYEVAVLITWSGFLVFFSHHLVSVYTSDSISFVVQSSLNISFTKSNLHFHLAAHWSVSGSIISRIWYFARPASKPSDNFAFSKLVQVDATVKILHCAPFNSDVRFCSARQTKDCWAAWGSCGQQQQKNSSNIFFCSYQRHIQNMCVTEST